MIIIVFLLVLIVVLIPSANQSNCKISWKIVGICTIWAICFFGSLWFTSSSNRIGIHTEAEYSIDTFYNSNTNTDIFIGYELNGKNVEYMVWVTNDHTDPPSHPKIFESNDSMQKNVEIIESETEKPNLVVFKDNLYGLKKILSWGFGNPQEYSYRVAIPSLEYMAKK